MAPHSKGGKSGPKGSKNSKKEDKTLKRKREAEDHDRLKKAIDELVCPLVLAVRQILIF